MVNFFAFSYNRKTDITKIIHTLTEPNYRFNIILKDDIKIQNISDYSGFKSKGLIIGIQTSNEFIYQLNGSNFSDVPCLLYGSLDNSLIGCKDLVVKKLKNVLNKKTYDGNNLREKITEIFNKFILMLNINGELKIITDFLGFYHLFSYHSNSNYYYSNNKLKLWKISSSIKSIFNRLPENSIIPNYQFKIINNEKLIIDQLKNLLITAIKKRLPKNNKIGILFSGGLDSLVMTKLLMDLIPDYSDKLILFSSGNKNSKDLYNARIVNNYLKLPIEIIEFNEIDSIKTIPHIFEIIQRCDTLNISLGLTEYFSFKRAAELGIKFLFSGQGADEIFYGYNKYKEAFLKNENISKLSDEDLFSLTNRNLERETKLSFYFNIDSCYPYLDPQVISFVRCLPIEYKIKNIQFEVITKFILRKIGEKIGIPKQFLIKKTAMQYGSGSMSILKKISKSFKSPLNSQYKITSYLENKFIEHFEKLIRN